MKAFLQSHVCESWVVVVVVESKRIVGSCDAFCHFVTKLKNPKKLHVGSTLKARVERQEAASNFARGTTNEEMRIKEAPELGEGRKNEIQTHTSRVGWKKTRETLQEHNHVASSIYTC